MLVTMDMCSVKAGSDYTTEVMCAGWNPEIAMMQDRAVELAEQLIQMGIPLTHVKFYWTVFAKTHHAAPPQDLNASPAKWLFAALEARPVFRITGATCVKGIPILIHYQSQRAGGMSVDVAAMDAEAFLVRMYASQG